MRFIQETSTQHFLTIYRDIRYIEILLYMKRRTYDALLVVCIIKFTFVHLTQLAGRNMTRSGLHAARGPRVGHLWFRGSLVELDSLILITAIAAFVLEASMLIILRPKPVIKTSSVMFFYFTRIKSKYHKIFKKFSKKIKVRMWKIYKFEINNNIISKVLSLNLLF